MANYSLTYTGAQTNNAVRKALQASIYIWQNVTVTTTAWTKADAYTQYPYTANVACAGCTADYFPEVVFDLDDALSGYFAPVCNSIANAVEIYASDIPGEDIVIPTIKGTVAVN